MAEEEMKISLIMSVVFRGCLTCCLYIYIYIYEKIDTFHVH